MTLSNHHYEQLAGIRRNYRDKRTLAWGLVDECLKLVESAIAEHEAECRGRIEQADVYVKQHRKTIENLRIIQTGLRNELDEKRTLRESRDGHGEEVQVTIDRSLKGWVVGDLEEIAYRLRCGGAVDDTQVKITDYSAIARVVAPDLVPLHRPGSMAPVERVVEVVRPPDWLVLANRVLASRWLALGLIITTLVMVLAVVW